MHTGGSSSPSRSHSRAPSALSVRSGQHIRSSSAVKKLAIGNAGKQAPTLAVDLSGSLSSPKSPRSPKQLTDENQNNFKVVVRVRPLLPRELSSGSGSLSNAVNVDKDNRTITLSECFDDSQFAGVYAAHTYSFDRVYDPDSTQAEIYEGSARAAVNSTLEGYNATLLAYGQTGSGKTFTMEGLPSNELRGIIPRSVEQIFDHIQTTANPNARFLVRASYLQIYNDIISDLLKPERSNLQIREDKRRGVFVGGLSEWVVRSPREVYGLMKKGSAVRATGSTRMNEMSSRSHALFIIIVEQTELQSEASEAHSDIGGSSREVFRVGKLNMVDLAGSERVRLSGASGTRLEESKNINQSLSALGNVIAALTDKTSRSHIPYRDSKLTRILEDSLGGNCKTTMMAMVSPAHEAFLETLSTLKFANRAKNIRNHAQINEDLDEKTMLRKYERELKQLRMELNERNRNVVDKRKLIEVEQQRKQAEADQATALHNLQMLSRDLLAEKAEKKRLELRIQAMNAQLLVGGQPVPVKETPAFKIALQEEQQRIRQEYQAKLAELEREREAMSEEMGQVERYKQLLLKQRDIMIQLTARLNERDQSILALTEELESYDRQHRHALALQSTSNVTLPKDVSNTSPTDVSRPDITASLETDASEDNIVLHDSVSPDQVLQDPASPSPSAVEKAKLRTMAQQLEEARTQQERLMDIIQESEKRKLEVETMFRQQLQKQVAEGVAAATETLKKQTWVEQTDSEAARLEAIYAEPLRSARSELETTKRELVALKQTRANESNATETQRLQQENNVLKDVLLQHQSDVEEQMRSVERAVEARYKSTLQEYEERMDAMVSRQQVQLKEREALGIILEDKMKTLVDNVSRALLDAGGADSVSNRTRQEVQVLQKLIHASATALKNANARYSSASDTDDTARRQ